MEEMIQLLEKQKSATRNVNPSYDAWAKKSEEVSLIQKQIETTKAALEAAAAALKQAEDILDGIKKQEPEVDRLKQIISRIDGEEQKYREKEGLEEKRKELEKLEQDIGEKEAELKECGKSLREKIGFRCHNR